MKVKSRLLFSILILFFFGSNAQESFILNGQIFSENNDTLSFCNLVIKNNYGSGAVSDYEGNFNIVVNLNDTLLISYIGYRPTQYIVGADKSVVIHLKSETVNLPTVNIIPRKNTLTAGQIINEMHNRMPKNELGDSENYKFHVNTSVVINKNNAEFYRFKGPHDLIKVKNSEFYANPKDSSYRTRRVSLISEVFTQPSSRPSYFLNFLFMPKSVKKDKASYYNYQMGEIEFYEGEEVYHVKFHRNKGGGYCESGGFYLISTESFATLYVEMIAKSCEITKPEKGKDVVVIDYHQMKVWFSKLLPLQYSRCKIEEEAKYTTSDANKISTTYYKQAVITVDKIEKISKEQVVLPKLVPAISIY